MTTIRSDANSFIDAKVEEAIQGMVIEKKIDEIDNWIGEKVQKDNSRSRSAIPQPDQLSDNHDQMLQYAIDCIEKLRGRRKSNMSP